MYRKRVDPGRVIIPNDEKKTAITGASRQPRSFDGPCVGRRPDAAAPVLQKVSQSLSLPAAAIAAARGAGAGAAAGAGVSELSSAFGLALEMGARLEDIGGTIHAHPTLGEAFHEASLRALGEALHI